MIPISDRNPRRSIPFATLSIVVINIAVFVYELSLGPNVNLFIRNFGVVPSLIWQKLGQGELLSVIPVFITATFIHGGWLHVGGNMLYLWIFGDNIEDKLGHLRFFIFYILSGLAALGTYIYFSPDSTTPTIGASGAVAGILGAYLVLYPRARVSILIPLFIFFPVVEVPAVIVLGIWFVTQLFNGLSPGQMAAPVAWWAHIGGFVAGALLVSLFKKRYSSKIYIGE